MKKKTVILCVLFFIGCKTLRTPLVYTVSYDRTEVELPVADYLVKDIVREENNLYVIDLERSDSVFRLFSHFDGEKNANDVEIHINDRVRVGLIEPSEWDRKTMWERMNPLDVRGVVYGVDISDYLLRGPVIRYCDYLNGPYLRSIIDSVKNITRDSNKAKGIEVYVKPSPDSNEETTILRIINTPK